MEIKIRGEKISVTEAIKEQITSKFQRLEKYFENPASIEVNVKIKVQNVAQMIEVTIPTNKFIIRVEESHNDLYAAIDLAVDKLERQIRKNKTRLKNKYKNIENFELNLNFDSSEEEPKEENRIVKRKTMEMKPMDEEEALLQAELLGHDFFVFKNIDENCTSVLYKRKDEKYGIINVK